MYAPSFDTQNQENAFALVCDFALACARANYKLNIMEQNTDENNIMADIYVLHRSAIWVYRCELVCIWWTAWSRTEQQTVKRKANGKRNVHRFVLFSCNRFHKACIYVLVKQKCNIFPQRSSQTFLPRGKTVVERMRPNGILPKQNIILNIGKQFVLRSIWMLVDKLAL